MEAMRKEEDTGRRSDRISMAQNCESRYVGTQIWGTVNTVPKRGVMRIKM